MLGLVTVCAQGEKGLCWQRIFLRGVPFWQLQVRQGPERFLCRRLRKGAKQLRRLGVQEAVFPENFAQEDIFLQRGIRPVQTLPFLRAMAVPSALWLLEQQGVAPERSTVLLCARRADGELYRTALELSRRVRYLALDVESGGEELCALLRREFGVSARLCRSGCKEGEAQLGLFYRDAGVDAGLLPCLPLYPGGEKKGPLAYAAGGDLEQGVWAGCEKMQLLSALFAAKALQEEEIRLDFARNYA